MTTFDAIVSIAQTLLRVKGEWQGGATAYADIDRRVSNACLLIGTEANPFRDAATAELRRRAA
jgi:hypothetical protein